MEFSLAHSSFGAEDGPTAFILHGILGSRRNWAGFARALAKAYPHWRFVTVDLRNHGDSSGAPEPHTLRACAADLDRLAQSLGRPTVMMGHSFGGKVALAYAREFGTGLEHLWSLDSPPLAQPALPSHEVIRVIAAARKITAPFASRQTVVDHFQNLGFSQGLARWMTTNVGRSPEGLGWRFDLDAIETMLADYYREDMERFLRAPGSIKVHILRAAKSDRWTARMLAQLATMPVEVVTLPEAGHWVHMDNPKGLLALLTGTFSGTASKK